MWREGVCVCVPLHREGIFVRVLGHIRTFSQQRSVVGFLVQPLKDFNEVTYHMVHVVHSQLALQKGAPVVRRGEGSVCVYRGSPLILSHVAAQCHSHPLPTLAGAVQ